MFTAGAACHVGLAAAFTGDDGSERADQIAGGESDGLRLFSAVGAEGERRAVIGHQKGGSCVVTLAQTVEKLGEQVGAAVRAEHEA